MDAHHGWYEIRDESRVAGTACENLVADGDSGDPGGGEVGPDVDGHPLEGLVRVG